MAQQKHISVLTSPRHKFADEIDVVANVNTVGKALSGYSGCHFSAQCAVTNDIKVERRTAGRRLGCCGDKILCAFLAIEAPGIDKPQWTFTCQPFAPTGLIVDSWVAIKRHSVVEVEMHVRCQRGKGLMHRDSR